MHQETAGSIVILTGAGISKESGLDTFRDADGIWAKVGVEEVATPEGFARDPHKVHAFYNDRRRKLLSGEVQPNAAHAALARLEAEWPGQVLLVTQNIDNLHRQAGSRNLIHMHGEHLKVRCEDCGAVLHWEEDLGVDTACPKCGAVGGMRPHVVWFGEMPIGLERIYAALDDCGLFVSIGTSGNVYPAAGFVQHVASRGNGHGHGPGHTVELNLEPSLGASMFAEARYGPATEVVPAFVDEILSMAAHHITDFRSALLRR